MNQKYFIVLSYPKSGTTSVSNLLWSHPNICLPNVNHNKETWFFSRKQTSSISEYLNNYQILDRCKVFGEVSTMVFLNKNQIDHLYSFFPDAKIIVILRDPIERAISKYSHIKRRYFISETIEEVLDNEEYVADKYGFTDKSMNDDFFECTLRYKENTEYLLKIFPKKNIKFFLFEDMVKNDNFSKDIFSFLNVDNIKVVLPKSNPARMPKSIAVGKIVLYLNKLFLYAGNKSKAIFPASMKNKLLYIYNHIFNILNMLEEKNMCISKEVEINPVIVKKLQSQFLEKNSGLSELIGIDIKKYWKWYV
jgi:hypothetical protein